MRGPVTSADLSVPEPDGASDADEEEKELADHVPLVGGAEGAAVERRASCVPDAAVESDGADEEREGAAGATAGVGAAGCGPAFKAAFLAASAVMSAY